MWAIHYLTNTIKKPMVFKGEFVPANPESTLDYGGPFKGHWRSANVHDRNDYFENVNIFPTEEEALKCALQELCNERCSLEYDIKQIENRLRELRGAKASHV